MPDRVKKSQNVYKKNKKTTTLEKCNRVVLVAGAQSLIRSRLQAWLSVHTVTGVPPPDVVEVDRLVPPPSPCGAVRPSGVYKGGCGRRPDLYEWNITTGDQKGERKGRRGGGAPLRVPPFRGAAVSVRRKVVADDEVSFTQLRSLAYGSLEGIPDASFWAA